MESISTTTRTTTLTFLFTDLEGSTRLWQKYPEAMKTALSRHDTLLRAAVEGAGGWVVKTTGDGFYAAFTSAPAGLQACIQAQHSLAAESWAETGPLRVRMGLHTGEAQQRDQDYFGNTINRTARLMSAANGGQVLLSEAVALLVADELPGGVFLRDLGEHRLKDLLRPEHVFQLVITELPSDFPPIHSLNQLPNNLPSQPTIFIGREEELAEINSLLAEDRVHLLTLIGPGGTGKTRLALQVGAELADRFTDGTYFIDLAPISDPYAVLLAIARSIGLSESSKGSIMDDLKKQLRDKNILLLLDNFEQVTSAAVQVAELLQYSPRLKLLATSREALRVRGEYLYPVSPLGLPSVNGKMPPLEDLIRSEAVQLFVARAAAVRPDFELTKENATAVAEICMRLDGLPLAIELAAARIRLFPPSALLQRLGSRLKLLKGGARDLPERQQTLRDTIEWSYDLLSLEEKFLFAVLSVFSGCTFTTVEAVISGISGLDDMDLDVIEGLTSLVDKSLIRLMESVTGEPRLRMLETIREYASERLQADPDLQAASCQAHAAYFAEFAQDQGQRLASPNRETALSEMATDVENLQIAWLYWVNAGDLTHMQLMVDGLWLLYDGRGWYHSSVEIATNLLDTLANTPSTPELVEQEILLQISLARALLAINGYTPDVEKAYTRALELSEGQGEIPQLFPVLRGLSSFYLYRAEFDKGYAVGQRIMELAEKRDDDVLRVHGYLVIGVNTSFLQGFAQGLAILSEGIALFESGQQSSRPFQLGNYPGIVCYTSSSFFSHWLGFPDRALELANRAITRARALKHPLTLAYTLFHTANLFLMRGELALAQERARELQAMATEYDFKIWQSLATVLIGVTLTGMGQTEEGLKNIEEGYIDYQELSTPPIFYPFLIGFRASGYAMAGRVAEGLAMLGSILNEIDEKDALYLEPHLVLLQGDLSLAADPENPAEAMQIFRRIVNSADHVGDKFTLLKAATQLCRLELQQGSAAASGQFLHELYQSFSEGFELSDLRAARAVIEAWQQAGFGRIGLH